jgi:SET domain-containing protein
MEYDKSGIKHFYFMSLKANEYIDATKRGNVSRFMNHSCNPNCQLLKWVVGSTHRVGMFVTSDVAQGTELTFDYKFERYGFFVSDLVQKHSRVTAVKMVAPASLAATKNNLKCLLIKCPTMKTWPVTLTKKWTIQNQNLSAISKMVSKQSLMYKICASHSCIQPQTPKECW